MLGLALRLLLGAVVVGTVGTVIVHVCGEINRSKIRDEARKHKIKEMIIKVIDTCNNTVKIEDLNSDKVLDVQGDSIDFDLNEGDVIYA